MVKYARIVFEEKIPDNATPKEALSILLKSMKNWSELTLAGGNPGTEDVEISDYPYERME